MPAQDYRIRDYKVSDRQDDHGNTWVNIAFEGQGQPVAYLTKDPTALEVGKVLHGEIKEENKRAGGTYYRFRLVKKEDGAAPQSAGHSAPQAVDWDAKQKTIEIEWAIGQANLQAVNGAIELDDIEAKAADFLQILERLRNPTPIDQWAVKKEADKIDPTPADDDKPVDLSDIPF